jgi:apolipoprotein N-acyltransferase
VIETAAGSRIESWFAGLTAWARRGVAFLAGALATLGHAPFQLTLLYVFALAVLLWLLDVSATKPRKSRSAFVIGWFFALGHFATGLYWISSAFNVDSDAWGPMWGIPATLALAGGLALFWGVGAAAAMVFWTRDVRRAAVFAVCFFIAEWLRGNILTGFPWLLPGYVWTPGEPISQIASIIGIYGLSLITLLAGGALAVVADGRSSQAQRFGPAIAMALAFGMIWGWGAQRLAHAPVDPPGALPLVRVADSGLSQAEKWRYSPDQEWRVLARYLAVSGPAEDSRESVVIWPEGAIPTLNFFMLDNPQFMSAIGRGLGDRVLVAGFTRCEPRPACDALWRGDGDASHLRLYNSAAVIDGVSGVPRLSQIYDKHHLVPFGEYIPFWSLVSQLNIAPLQRIGAGFVAGPRPTRLVVPDAPPAVILVCYEAIFPGLTPHGDERPGWIINVTNDAWFGNGTGPHQHFAMARYRAIEEGLPLARAASGGISAIVDAEGRVMRSTQNGGSVTVQLPPALGETPYVTLGNWLLLALLLSITALRLAPASAAGPRKQPR